MVMAGVGLSILGSFYFSLTKLVMSGEGFLPRTPRPHLSDLPPGPAHTLPPGPVPQE